VRKLFGAITMRLGAPVRAAAAKWWPLIKEFGIKAD
jgi:hypothetical protein